MEGGGREGGREREEEEGGGRGREEESGMEGEGEREKPRENVVEVTGKGGVSNAGFLVSDEFIGFFIDRFAARSDAMSISRTRS